MTVGGRGRPDRDTTTVDSRRRGEDATRQRGQRGDPARTVPSGRPPSPRGRRPPRDGAVTIGRDRTTAQVTGQDAQVGDPPVAVPPDGAGRAGRVGRGQRLADNRAGIVHPDHPGGQGTRDTADAGQGAQVGHPPGAIPPRSADRPVGRGHVTGDHAAVADHRRIAEGDGRQRAEIDHRASPVPAHDVVVAVGRTAGAEDLTHVVEPDRVYGVAGRHRQFHDRARGGRRLRRARRRRR